MVAKLELWNMALVDELGVDPLRDTGEGVEAGRMLVRVHSQVVEECLSTASWNFLTETVKLDADTGVTPAFGYPKVFAKPADWVRTVAISEDEHFSLPLLRYYDDQDFWSAESSPIYVRYASNDTGLGLNLDRWTPLFTRYVALEEASRVCMKLTGNRSLKKDVDEARDKARRAAKNQDAMDEPNPKFPPPSSWTQVRGGRSGGWRDRGSRGSLIG